MWTLVGAVLVIAIVSSTREGRSEASAQLAKYNWHFGIATAAIWGILLYPW